MYKILLWGAGVLYNKHLNLLKLYEKAEELKIIGITAENLKGKCCLDGFPIYMPEKIVHQEFDYLMIMNDRYFQDIMTTAIRLGVQKEKIISYKVLEIPNLSFDSYFKLKQENISIISNNCWGGILYKTLGMECLSPFKNLFLEDADYLNLLSDFRKYMTMPLLFDCYEKDIHSKETYPVMSLGDIRIHFNHDKEIEYVVEKWERRKAKINYNNLFVEMYTEDRVIAERFSKLDEFKKKLCFVPFETEMECCMKLELEYNQSEFWEAVNSSASKAVVCNLVDLLNMKRTYRME